MRGKLNVASLIAVAGGLVASLAGADVVARSDPGARAAASRTSEVQKSTPQRLAQLDQNTAVGNWRRTGRNGKRTPGLGWPVATDRRNARKKRNVAKNRRAHR